MPDFIFSTPSLIQDFSENPTLQQQLNQYWDLAIDAYTQAALVSNPWTVNYQAPCDWYVNPKNADITVANPVEPIFWTAFPNRLKIYFSTAEKSPYQMDNAQVFALADFGNIPQSRAFPTGLPFIIPSKRCPNLNWQQPISEWVQYDPKGPRGWLDEYCEWAVTRNSDGKITKIVFTCENPEYWYSLWQVSPEKVLTLYQQLVNPNVALEDLMLPSTDGKGFATDPTTGRAAYNPLNKWNSGTVATETYGGAVHLTSPPNTIGAEIMLAAQATLLRELPADQYNMQRMVCAGAYGRAYRNSDPHIGLQVNQLVKNLNVKVTLTNPVGLYLQRPDFSSYKTPDGQDASQFYKVIRGRTAEQAGTTYDQILHAEFSVPEELGYTVSDILIGNSVPGSSQVPVPILYAGQIAETFHVCLAGTAITPATGEPSQSFLPPVSDITGNTNGQVSMLLANPILLAMQAVNPYPPFVQLPVQINQGQTLTNMALQVSYANDNFNDAQIAFWDEQGNSESGISVAITAIETADGTPAGKSSGGDGLFNYILSISVAATVSTGLKGVTVRNPNCDMPVPLPGVLNVNTKGN
jgi:hypothetical protein